jgi:acetolactate synthase regulatory subunit
MAAADTANPAVPQDDTLRMTVFMAPSTHALARLLLLVRGRGANVLDLRWRVTSAGREGIATLFIGLEKDRQPHLQAAIVRIVDVKSVVIL